MTLPSEIAIFFATHDGHTRKIVDVLTCHLESKGKEVAVYDLGKGQPSPISYKSAQTVVVLAPIRFGFHLSAVDKFVRTNKEALHAKQFVLISINLTARKPEKNTPETNPYMRKWVKKRGLMPAIQAVFGGYLEYRRYRLWERHIIRFIMWMTKGPTDFNASIDFTDWSKVETLASDIDGLAGQAAQEIAA